MISYLTNHTAKLIPMAYNHYNLLLVGYLCLIVVPLYTMGFSTTKKNSSKTSSGISTSCIVTIVVPQIQQGGYPISIDVSGKSSGQCRKNPGTPGHRKPPS